MSTSERTEDIMSIFWSHTKAQMKHTVAICKPSSNSVTFIKRARCQQPELSLHISELTEDDSGLYEAVIYSTRDPLHAYFYLHVNGVITHVVHEKLSAARGGSILFRDLSSTMDVHRIFWSYNTTGDVCLLAIANTYDLKVISDRFKSRVRNQQPGLSLNLSGLTERDSGIYEALVLTTGEPILMYFNLQVIKNSPNKGIQWTWNYILLMTGLGVLIAYITTES
ncbi:uncharacterized protein [Hyperolius riggenbachi]|uniref:uncharacterized protein n=1 Tax=Hyperolius riggenbachi TaxID=752182 RepID=UPI0035A37978